MNIRVLLVDDSDSDQQSIRKSLQGWEHDEFEIVCVNTLKNAIDKLMHDKFDIILTDLGLSDSSGIETFISIRNKSAGLPIIILTNLDDQKLAIKAIRMGAESYVSKSNLNSLGKDICYALARHGVTEREEANVKNHFSILSNVARRLRTEKIDSVEIEE